MKKIYLIIAVLAGALSANAQLDWGGVPVIPDSYAHKVSKDGTFVAGETTDGGFFTHNTKTGEEHYYGECYGGMGNSIAENGWMVASYKITSKGVILTDGKIKEIPSLRKYSESYLYGITWDATRLCGIVINPNLYNQDFLNPDFEGQMYVPVYMDISSEGEISEPVFLPYPKKDLFQAPPQYCSAVWISDDGKTIVGQVIDNTGFYIYPIVYKQDAEGEWSCSLPSEDLFNMTHMKVPTYPHFEMQVKQVQDFMTDDEKKEFDAALADPYFDGDPYDMLEFFMTPDELEEYYEWYAAYMDYSYYYSEEVLPVYYAEMSKLIQNSVFFVQNAMAVNSEGTLLATPRDVAYWMDNSSMPVRCMVPYLFNLEDGSYQQLAGDYSSLNPNQILSDGTVICSSNRGNGAVVSSVKTPESEEFVPIEQWLYSFNPAFTQWMNDYLHHDVAVGVNGDNSIRYEEITVSGLVSVSDDVSVVAAGVDGWSWDLETGMYFTYVLTDGFEAGVGQTMTEEVYGQDSYVYSLQGVKVGESLENLAPGLYIYKGKKILIK